MKKQKIKFLEREYTVEEANVKLQRVFPNITLDDADEVRDFLSDVCKDQPAMFARVISAFRGTPDGTAARRNTP